MVKTGTCLLGNCQVRAVSADALSHVQCDRCAAIVHTSCGHAVLYVSQQSSPKLLSLSHAALPQHSMSTATPPCTDLQVSCSYSANRRSACFDMNTSLRSCLCSLCVLQLQLAECIADPQCFENLACLQLCNGRKDEAGCQVMHRALTHDVAHIQEHVLS